MHSVRYSKGQQERGLRLKKIFKKVYEDSSRAEIAAHLNVSYGAIGQWYKGASINGDVLEKLSRDGGDLHYLFTGEASVNVYSDRKNNDTKSEFMEDARIYCLGRLVCIEAGIREQISELAGRLARIKDCRKKCMRSESYAVALAENLQQDCFRE